MVVCLLLLLAKGEAAAGERTLFAAVMTVVVDTRDKNGILGPRDIGLQFRVHRTTTLQELRWSSTDDFRRKVKGTPRILGSGDSLENQLLNRSTPASVARISDNLGVSTTVLLKEIAMPRRLLTWCLASALFIAAFAVPHAETPAASKPNYDLAANWTAQKVGRLVFDTTVTPRWLESGDRFWYPYQTREGRRFYLVDPIKKSKAPLFDHAKMAATLTSITREPYDAQHLPFTTVKFVRKDAAFEFDVQVPRDADVAKPKKPINTTDAQAAARPVGQDPADDDGRRSAAAGAAGPRRRVRPRRPAAENPDAALRVRHGDRQR